MSGQLTQHAVAARRHTPAIPQIDVRLAWQRLVRRLVRRLAGDWSLSQTPDPAAEAAPAAGSDVPSPRRGAFPSPRSDVESAPEYVPDEEVEGGRTETEPDPSEGSSPADRETTRGAGEDA